MLTAINFTDNSDPNNQFNSSRTPLVYVLHKLFNPFLENQIDFRRSVFIISLSGPVLFYFCLKQKFKESNLLLFLIASVILLSPYFRTNSYWGGEINYGIITMLTSVFLLNYTLFGKPQKKLNIYFLLTLLNFFS